MERVTLVRERQRIAEERLKALRQQRKKLEESIIKMSNEMSRDIDLATEDRKQRRINMENEYLNQIDLEEAAVDDFFPVLSRVEEIQPDVCCDIGQIDIFSRIELFPSIVLSSEKTNCKNDIQ